MEYKLSIVGTPIGNLEDISLRALKTLQAADVILCEDTRTSLKLLNHFEIFNKSLLSYHNFNEKAMCPKIIKLIKEENKKVALISDAGMPCISDPGFAIVQAAKANEIFIDVIGGPSALICAIIKANFASQFTFLGFLKDKSLARQNELKKLMPGTYVCYLSPHKLISTINDFLVVFGDGVKLYLIKEMTKLHETSYEGSPSEILAKLPGNIKGEFTLVFLIQAKKLPKINKYAK
ncbi:putative SAM-dependent methyltransferase [Metamycoplasma arthritidis]|uniref:Ribosomal RNA small subunit methyltransferase I n=1 Tax=Metamycoplasma arthritidis (strain 158L3-1) TaxID=243272 RepID=B3PM39_META1|nr:16S rRNA (cytidine(1402)-2'-O)-methyltransferase [Metamycoplasma arthritidis]ACF07091.1 putative SAM-dependent methyltransferase [Metamycoplasma arthritidis 158L3-1]VEU78619.1 putative SAM-dependent methyltransferase [Metamycoplasma arthritidis]